ncbi:MAG: PEGA domain-containing protein [Myxococcota bacterium]
MSFLLKGPVGRAALTLLIVMGLSFESVAQAQTTDVNAEARVFFDRGNELLSQAGRARGRRRRRLLEESLQAFVSTLRIVRSRNALFNAALVLEQLDRPAEAFGYYQEYLGIPGLDEEERQQGAARVAAIAPRIAIVSIASNADAEVFVDRLDLAARGQTPLRIALPPGDHTLFFRHPHYEDSETRVTAVIGEEREVEQTLTPRPVAVTLETPMEGQLTLDGEAVQPGTVNLPPGPHLARFEVPGRSTTELRFEVEIGQPQTIRLDAGAVGAVLLVVRSNRLAMVSINGEVAGRGREVRTEVSPGSHRLTVEANGYEPYEGSIEAELEQPARVSVVLEEEGRPLGAAPHVMLGVSAAAAVTWAALAGRARKMRNDFNASCTRESCDGAERSDVNDANRAADIVLGVAGALTLTTVVLYLLNRGGEESRATIDVAASRQGGGLLLRGAF